MELKVGDIVARISYKGDVFFKIDEIFQTESGEVRAKLRGLDVRLLADSPLHDLVRIGAKELQEYRRRFIRQNNECLRKIFVRRMNPPKSNPPDFFEVPGRVLHADGNKEYLSLCTAIYKQLGIEAYGIHIPEKDQPASVPGLIEKYRPDILVLTGHDGIIKTTERYADIKNYHNSAYFVEGVKQARKIEPDKDSLIIFAGACQSHYEAILAAGANFASSPHRVFINAFDPVFVVERIAFTPVSQIVPLDEVIDNTITKMEGLGGIETRGKHRRGFPRSPYQVTKDGI